MGEWYSVGLQTGKNVTVKVEEYLKKLEEKGNRLILDEKRALSDGSTLYVWNCKWCPSWFKDQQDLVDLLRSFPDEEEYDIDNAYKFLAWGDEGGHDEFANAAGWENFDGLYSNSEVILPGEKDQALIDKITEALEKTDAKVNAEVIGNLLMDDQVNVYKAFEDLCSRYVNGSEEFRSGIDAALTILTYKNLSEITDECLLKKEA